MWILHTDGERQMSIDNTVAELAPFANTDASGRYTGSVDATLSHRREADEVDA